MTRSVFRIGCWTILGLVSWYAVADGDSSHGKTTPPGERPLAVLKRFPLEPDFYCPQAAALLRGGIVEKFGREEWAAVVMAHELHQHVGIYTVLGAKMGVRARELLDAPTRAVHVIVETGLDPPASCTVDGIQASLASTLAQKLIEVPPDVSDPRVAATFEYRGRSIRLSLRPEYAKKVKNIIQTAIETHGNLTPAYFHEIEDRSFDVWAEFDRREVFLVEHLSASPAGKH